ncbi:hypothetical protein LguiA_032895 [Lonicera macranthoides]
MATPVKQEIVPPSELLFSPESKVIDILSDSDDNSSSTDDDDDTSNIDGGRLRKKQKVQVVLPVRFLDPLTPEERALLKQQSSSALPNIINQNSMPPPLVPELSVSAASTKTTIVNNNNSLVVVESCKQFWKAGDYDGGSNNPTTTDSPASSHTVGMDHARVHPKFLHSNATSHKWALGAFAELLDNALDEVCNGATYVHIDMLKNKKDNSKMLIVEDNGGGMTPDTMRQCMSLGYSLKSKLANTIGQYGNGFKTSTMRLGADVIVFSRCWGKDGRSPTQSIGMLSYTFLRKTGKEDIVVPMIDYEKREDWKMMVRYSPDDWRRNLETILPWSPYASEEDLLQQFNSLKDQGTRIVIYNLWEDDQGDLELDFDTNDEDIQIRGVNRDEKKIEMAKIYPNLTHFLTYRHSLRNYAAILYLRIPPGFRIILRGKDVNHHNLVDDMMLSQEVTYKPVAVSNGTKKDQNMFAVVTIGFVKDAKHHLDVQGFNVYHKNRLIKPFWRVWNAAGSDGRGVIGVLEANFVEPAHDKQGFERTIVLSRLEARLVVIQKNYWSTNCHKIGYAKRRHLSKPASPEEGSAPSAKEKSCLHSKSNGYEAGGDGKSKLNQTRNCDRRSPAAEDASEDEMGTVYYETPTRRKDQRKASGTTKEVKQDEASNGSTTQINGRLCIEAAGINGDEHAHADSNSKMLVKLKEENRTLTGRLEQSDGFMVVDLLRDLQQERDRNNLLEDKFQKALQRIEEMDKEQEALINVFAEERERREQEEDNLRRKLKGASDTIEELLNKVKFLERKSHFDCKVER